VPQTVARQVPWCAAVTAAVVFSAADTGSLFELRRGAQIDRRDLPEVRHLVMYRFQRNGGPFGMRPSMPAMDSLLELYRETPPVLRVRGYREAESAEPFDLILATNHRGLEGFEQAMEQLAKRSTDRGVTFGVASRRIDEASEWHRDWWVELIEDMTHTGTGTPELHVFEWVRVFPSTQPAYELLLRSRLVPFERDQTNVRSSETGRVLIGDEWDYLRIVGFPSLSAYHDYRRVLRDDQVSEEIGRFVALRKMFVVRQDGDLSVR
jgi:hypothetical protein